MKELKITTVRKMTDSQYKDYRREMSGFIKEKRWWDKLEETGKATLVLANPGEDVISEYELKEV